MTELLDNQHNAINRLSDLKVGALFDTPGKGKTRSAIELIRSVPGIDYVLWLAPYRSVNPDIPGSGIKDEVAKWGGFECETEFIGIESLSNSGRIYLELFEKLKAKTKPFIVCDESLQIKNFTAKRTRRIIELGKLAEYKLILNGTPMSRNLLDLWAQFEFLSPLILNMGIAEFKNTFVEFTTIRKRIGNRWYEKLYINRYHNIEYLYSIIKHYVYEADLDFTLTKQFIDIPYRLEKELLEEYQFIKDKYLDNEKLNFIVKNIFLELTQKMQHLYCCAAEKFEIVERILKEHGEDKVIIFAKFIASQEELKKRFPNATVFSLQKHTTSLNLQQFHITIFFDKIWDFAKVYQGIKRTDREGQKHECIYYMLSGNVGLESMMDRNINNKVDLATFLNQVSVKELKESL